MHRRRPGHRAAAPEGLIALTLVAALSAATSLLAPSQPGYDPWAWLLWGRELVALDLDTVAGPAFKPLPVLVAAALAPLGDAAPAAWLWISRSGAILAVLLGARLAWRLAGGSRVAAAVAGAGIALSAGWWWHAAVGHSEGLFLALALGALDAALDRHHGRALALGVAAALLRPESWPFLGAYGLWLWLRRPALRAWLAGAAIAVPALWIGPELWGSSEALRASARARIPNPGAPATAAVPALAALREAAGIPLWPAALAALVPVAAALRGAPSRVAAVPAAAGAAWVALVALMAQAGYSGEPRYSLPGVAAIAVSGGVGAAWLARGRGRGRGGGRGRAALVVALAAGAPFVAVRASGAVAELRGAADQAALYGSLREAVARAGGRAAVLACGRPVVGPLRAPALAWALGVHKRRVGFDPARGGMVFRSRLRVSNRLQPRAPAGAAVVARSARWEVRGRCGPRSVRDA